MASLVACGARQAGVGHAYIRFTIGLQDVQRALAAASQWDASNVREEDLFMLRRTCRDLSLVRAGWLLWLARLGTGAFRRSCGTWGPS